MPYEPNVQGLHPAYHFPEWHTALECYVDLVPGPIGVWVWCKHCRVAAQLDAVSTKIKIATCGEPTPWE